MTVPAMPLNVIVEVVPVCDPLLVYPAVLVSALVFAPRIPVLFMVIPATVVVATSVTVSPPLIVIESVAAGVPPPQAVQVAATLKLPPPVPFEEQLRAYTFETGIKRKKRVISKPIVIFLYEFIYIQIEEINICIVNLATYASHFSVESLEDKNKLENKR
jgi:hypothetical protein